MPTERLTYWKCPKCHGIGKVIAGRIGSARVEPCFDCDGTGNGLVDGAAAEHRRDMDIVDRLRLGGPNAMEVVGQAADEIERLRAALEYIAGQENLTFAECSIAEEIIGRAKAALKR